MPRSWNGFTAAPAHQAKAHRQLPEIMVKAAIRYGNVGPDPQGAAGALRYTIETAKNGVNHELEVVARQTAINVYEILHFMYYCHKELG